MAGDVMIEVWAKTSIEGREVIARQLVHPDTWVDPAARTVIRAELVKALAHRVVEDLDIRFGVGK